MIGWLIAGWFLLFVFFCQYKVAGMLRYLKHFYEKGLLPDADYKALKGKWSGQTRFYVKLPDHRQYAALYADPGFAQFTTLVRFATVFFVVTAIMILWKLGS
ncbi:hypothetical protein KK062_14845 [Fulvivirgaceae bacterium PWU5]|uniref:Uncharacterized protein n=1 Tax=Dawidia cretensis TaxID=2782350 RepID=A0AAP2E0L9_9BACT|nr:hypothetical protein [Dawidia cretensis]MBT1709517.1 hypothetical protein [Dawidia cretensis]